MRNLVYFLLVCFLVSGCNTEPLALKEVIDFQNPPATLPADNERHPIRVKITDEADIDKRTIVFTVEPEIAVFENGQATIEVQAIEQIASVLISSAEKGVVQLKAHPKAFPDYTIQTAIEFVEPDLFSVAISPPDTAIPADNDSTFAITVRLQAGIEPKGEKVIFETDRGTFSDNEPKIERFFNSANEATVFLKHHQPGTAILSIQYSGQTKSETVVFRALSADDLYSFSPPNPTTITADGVESSQLDLKLKRALQTDDTLRVETQLGAIRYQGREKQVHLLTNLGEDELTFFFTSSEVGTAYLTVSYLGISQTQEIICDTAPPTDIVLIPSDGKFRFSSAQTKEIKALLFRNPGRVSPGTLINFRSLDPELRVLSTQTSQIEGDQVFATAVFQYDTPHSDTVSVAVVASFGQTADTLSLEVIP